MERNVFIPTRGRWDGIGKLCDIWVDKGFTVHLMVESSEFKQYYTATPQEVCVNDLPESNRGVSYSRNRCVEIAHQCGMKSIILADDDIKPSTRRYDGMGDILDACQHPKILGMTARYSYHDLCLGPDIKGMDDIILLPTGTFRLVGLNIENVLKIGNYDTGLEYAEDCDLFLRGLQAGIPWMVHLGSFANSIGTRYEPGGMLDYAGAGGLADAKARWHATIHDKWPTVTNEHTRQCAGKQNCIRMYWQKAYDQFIPNWRDWSELHGGHLQGYIDA